MTDSEAWSLVPEEEITHCTICGKKIWKLWRTENVHDGNVPKVETLQCGPCYFSDIRKDLSKLKYYTEEVLNVPVSDYPDFIK